jgi:hypothetical protein
MAFTIVALINIGVTRGQLGYSAENDIEKIRGIG